MLAHVWPPEVSSNGLFSSVNSWVSQIIVVPVHDVDLQRGRYDYFCFVADELSRLPAPMKRLQFIRRVLLFRFSASACLEPGPCLVW
jgi:hypothetical protein